MKKHYIQNILILIASLALSLTAAELTARWSAIHRNSALRRNLFYDKMPFEISNHAVVKYKQNALIREVAVYGNRIEYDVKYRTNNYGAVDDKDYTIGEAPDPDTRRYALVGDSFGVGAGGFSWIPRLRKQLENSGLSLRIYNLSATGMGFWNFFNALEDASRDFALTDIVILAISNDFYRLPAFPFLAKDRIYFVFKNPETNATVSIFPIARLIDSDAHRNSILRQARKAEAQTRNASPEQPGGKPASIGGFLSEKSYFFRWIREFFKFTRDQPKAHATPQKLSDLRPLQNIRARFPKTRIYLVHLPVKEEIAAGRYEIDIQKDLERLGIVYFPLLERLRWSQKMFHQYDPHCTVEGYQKICDALAAFLLKESGR